MQTTLLGLAIALILALVTALVGPLLIDWGTYRALFEREASHLAGVEVRVTGAIDARLLPSPRLTLHDIEIGAGADKVRAQALGIEFALGPLMRGEWRATDMQLSGPQLTLALDPGGKVQAPAVAVAFDPDALAIERLSISEGKLTLADAANGASVTLDKFWFNGEARSLLGPFKGEGAFAVAGELYPYRVATGRYGDDGALKLRLTVDPVARPLSIDVDGALSLAGGAPKFDGTLALAKPVGIAERGMHLRGVTPPWRLSGKVKARAQSALIENLEFQYGPEEQGVRLTGVADLTFGKRPLFNVIVSGRQIDLDRVFSGGDGARPPPAATLRALVELGGGLVQPDFPIQVGLGIDQVTLGGGAVQSLRGDISSAAGRWNLDRLEFRAPGYTQVKLSGGLTLGDTGVAFTGPAEIESSDAKALTAWLEGRGDVGQNDPRALRLRGDVTLSGEKIGIERLRADFERKSVAGRLAYVFGTPARKASLDAELNAAELDIDAALGFGKALAAGSKFERPHNMTIAADIGRATVAGFTARDARARVKVDGEGLQIDRLSVADLGGAAFSANGRIVTGGVAPQGDMRVDLDAPDLAPVIALLKRVAPETAKALESRAASMAPAKLRAQFTLDGAAPAPQGKLAVDGSLGAVRVALNAQGRVDVGTMSAGDLQFGGTVSSGDGKRLLAVLGLDRWIAAGDGPGALTLKTGGPAGGGMTVEAKLTAAGLDASAEGTAQLSGDRPAAALRASLRADVGPLRGKGAALPLTYNGRIALAGNEITFSDIAATAGGATLGGKLALTLGAPYRLTGEIEADAVDGGALLAAAIGAPSAPQDANVAWSWSGEPFAGGSIGAVTGAVALKARRVALLPQVSGREMRATLRFAKDEIAVEDIDGAVDGGRLNGRVALQAAGGGVKARGAFALSGADAASILGAGARPAIAGTLGLTAEVEGSGLSPVALIGSLQGSGKVTLANGHVAGLDPRAFDTVTRAVDQGLVIDQMRIGDVVRRTLASGQLVVKSGEGALTVSAGQVRLNKVSADSQNAGVALSGNLDLIDGALDARLVLTGTAEAAGARPDIYMALKGPFTSPTRAFDVSALTGWLTLRAVEHQAKNLQAAERAARKPEAAPALPAPQTIAPPPGPTGASPPAPSIGAQN